MKIENIYSTIKYGPTTADCIQTVGLWRDRGKGTRIVVAGPSLALLGIGCLIESVTSLAIGILLTPLEVFNFRFSRHFFTRAHSLFYAGTIALTHLQFTNIMDEKIFERIHRIEKDVYKLEKFYREIKKPPLSYYGIKAIGVWRNQGTGLNKGVRVVATSGSFALLGITGIIESILSLALGILTAPTEIIGLRLSRHFLTRAYLGVFFARLSLTTLQYSNIVDENVFQRLM